MQVTFNKLAQMKRAGEKIACITCYDASFARIVESAGVDMVLVGDSLGMVIQGHTTTLPVSMADMLYHSGCVARALQGPLLIADLPFMSYASPHRALGNAARLAREAGVHGVKPEGGAEIIETVRHLTGNGIPVCGHLGLLPQSVHKLGGYHVQGRDVESAQRILDDACSLEEAGASLLVLECVPADLAKSVTQRVGIPVIGIGAGADCDGQVLVLYDILGLSSGKTPRFVKNFLAETGSVEAAVKKYVEDVRTGAYPGPEHSY